MHDDNKPFPTGSVPPPREVMWSLRGNDSVDVSWSFTVNPNLCANAFQATAVDSGGDLGEEGVKWCS